MSPNQGNEVDNGSPWRTPLLQEKKPYGLSLMRIDRRADSRIFSIQLINLGSKLRDRRTCRRNGHSKVSKALTMSSFKATLPINDFLGRILADSETMPIQLKI